MACLLSVRVTPRSSKNLVRLDGYIVKVWVMASPTDGQANRAVCELIAKALGLAKSSVSVERGESSRDKVLRIESLSTDDVGRRLAAS